MCACVTVNDAVSIKNPTTHRTIKGVVRFIGSIEQQVGTFYGIDFETDAAESSDLYFVKRKEILTSEPSEMPRVTVGDIVKVIKFNCNGVIRYIGNTQFKQDTIWFGVQLEEAKGKNNGSVSNVKYFECEPNYGIFVQANGIEIVKSNSRKKRKKTRSTKHKSKPKASPKIYPPLKSQPGTPTGEESQALDLEALQLVPDNVYEEGLICCPYVKKEDLWFWTNRVAPPNLAPYESMRQDGVDNDTIAKIMHEHHIPAYWINKFFLSKTG